MSRQTDIALKILSDNKLSVTPPRKAILEVLLKSKWALSYAEIDKLTGGNLDRITVYRTFLTLLDNQIIHIVPTKDDVILYALTRGKDSNHVHFICSKCGRTYCLEGVKMPVVKLPDSYKVESSETVVYGICEKCKK